MILIHRLLLYVCFIVLLFLSHFTQFFCLSETIHCYLVVDAPELPTPACVVEERSEVKAVVVRAVALGVVGRGHRGHLVAIH